MALRSLVVLALALVAASPVGAQSAGSSADPDKNVQGGALPAGWHGRTDRPTQKLSDAKFASMAPGFHITSGPAAIYWREADQLSSPYTVTATFVQMKAPAHPEAYGIFFGGANLEAASQSYFYVLVRGTGDVLVSHRAGAEVHTLSAWAPNAAVKKQDAAGKATNTLRISAAADSTRVFVNGAPVFALPGNVAVAGLAGLRVNHNLDVHVSEFTVTRGQPAAATSTSTKKMKVKATAKKRIAVGKGGN